MEYDKDFNFPGESHDFSELVYCDHGRLLITGDRHFVLSKGWRAFYKPMINELAEQVLTLDDIERKILSWIISEPE